MKQLFNGQKYFTISDLSNQSLINRRTIDGMIHTTHSIPAPVARPETGRRPYYDEAVMAQLLAYFAVYRTNKLAENRARLAAEQTIIDAIGPALKGR